MNATAPGRGILEAQLLRLSTLEREEGADEDAQRRRQQLRVDGQRQLQLPGEGERPLTPRRLRQNFVHQVYRRQRRPLRCA